MAKPEFHIRIAGQDVAPETVDVSDLVTLVSDLRKAIAVTADLNSEAPSRTGPILSLVGVEIGSSRLHLAVAGFALAAVARITQAIATDDYASIPYTAQEALARMSKQAVNRGWELNFQPGRNGPIKAATISEAHEVPDPRSRTANGTTTVYGRCMRVGGEDPVARIKLAGTNETITATFADEKMVIELAHRLYRDVGLVGRAIWTPMDWKIVEFEVQQILPYEPIGAERAFQDLAEAAAGRWDDVDAVEYVRSLRGEDEEG
ncbi:MAG TPA: hypothetical protein VMG10_30970 [Gemmataceae bacterium]|nr:hypothetical protein [Gemmataceae bacterium]